MYRLIQIFYGVELPSTRPNDKIRALLPRSLKSHARGQSHPIRMPISWEKHMRSQWDSQSSSPCSSRDTHTHIRHSSGHLNCNMQFATPLSSMDLDQSSSGDDDGSACMRMKGFPAAASRFSDIHHVFKTDTGRLL